MSTVNNTRTLVVLGLGLSLLGCGSDGGDTDATEADASAAISRGQDGGGTRDNANGGRGPNSSGAKDAGSTTEPPASGPCEGFSLTSPDGICRLCGDCSALMEVGLSTGLVFTGDIAFTDQLHCMCEAAEGAFGSDGESVTLARCDADGDGWISQSAQLAMGIDDSGTVRASADPALRANARCQPRIIDRVILHSDASAFAAGAAHEVKLSEPLVLVESDRNDDDAKLASHIEAYGSGAARFSAAELNGFTKACSPGDHNDNGLDDVDEWDTKSNAAASQLAKRLQQYGYFVELAHGWYEPPAGGSGHGAYHIEERARAATATGPTVPLQYLPADGTDYWRSCIRRPDSSMMTREQPNQDQARLWSAAEAAAMPGFAGLHHSQFKCMRVATAVASDTTTVNLVPVEKVNATLLRWNECARSGAGAADEAANPALSQFTCTAVENPSLTAGAVAWAAIRYNHRASHDDGLGLRPGQSGCISECEAEERTNLGCDDPLATCESLRVPPALAGAACTPASEDCRGSASELGKLLCGCEEFCCDADGDGYCGATSALAHACGSGATPSAECASDAGDAGVWMPTRPTEPPMKVDCDDASNARGPGSPELCNGIDDDCDTIVDNRLNDSRLGMPCSPGLNPDGSEAFGHCRSNGISACANGGITCVASAAQAPSCRIADADCDGPIDERTAEVCDGVDNDCNGQADDHGAVNCTPYGVDSDGDSYFPLQFSVCACTDPGFGMVVIPDERRAPSMSDWCDYPDGGEDTHPRAVGEETGFYTAADPCGNWDRNQDGISEVQYKTTNAYYLHWGCSDCAFGAGDVNGAHGWLISRQCNGNPSGCAPTYRCDGSSVIPDCGQTRTWLDGCRREGGPITREVTQPCR